MAYIESLLPKCTTFFHIKVLQSHLFTTGLFHHYPSRCKLLDHCATTSTTTFPFSLSIFHHIPPPGPLTNDFNAIIRGYSNTNKPINAITFYSTMLKTQVKPDALTCSFTLKACARALGYLESLQIHAHVVKFGFLLDVLLQTTLLDVYAKCGDLGNAHKVFDEMFVKDIASWNALISGLAQGSRPYEALELFRDMRMKQKEPNEVTVLGALSACSQLGAVKEGERVYECIRLKGLDGNVIVCNAVIDMYAKCGFVEKAYGVFDFMRCSKNVITWNTMIAAFAMHGEGVRALELFDRMEEEGIRADHVSYLAALCACNHTGMVDEGMRLFEKMDKFGVVKNVKHYGSMVDLLGRAGRLKEAYEIIESMPMTPDVVLWQTLLGACKTYGNTEIAEKASTRLVEMGSTSCGDFVLLSNIYAAQERWKDVGRVRDAMKMRDVKKVPGFSYIEVGVIYKFINGDQSHPRNKEIYHKLDEVRFKTKEYGYSAGTSYVLHDIGQEEKENALSYHSEKLAVAFGLISTREGTSISVNKNLRICGDCHEVMKLISKIYDREIIVRDRTRFHRFKEGSCSCKDYW
ncbi:hypothetical protein LIER_19673 [Lithospermum erythrorhizon]|uniref:DYW domain-containing protein n=1 Tax=Lithospermum erythrorhizon TaxID=34254 RepID=A0AAV3QLA0_LITER